jgi:hypothetical protein
MVLAATCGEIWWCCSVFGAVKKEGSFYSAQNMLTVYVVRDFWSN